MIMTIPRKADFDKKIVNKELIWIFFLYTLHIKQRLTMEIQNQFHYLISYSLIYSNLSFNCFFNLGNL